MQIKKLVSLPSRTGRHLQRYNEGLRLVVGCIPYRIRGTNRSPFHGTSLEDLEVLLITSQKSTRLMFPKGGWELDENIELAASRETLEEAGVIGELGDKLGEWIFKSKRQDKFHEGSMFPLRVTEELDVWPEKSVRQRVWMTVDEARKACSDSWMIDALDKFVNWIQCNLGMEKMLTMCRSEELCQQKMEKVLSMCRGEEFVCQIACHPRVEKVLPVCRGEDLRLSIVAQTADEGYRLLFD